MGIWEVLKFLADKAGGFLGGQYQTDRIVDAVERSIIELKPVLQTFADAANTQAQAALVRSRALESLAADLHRLISAWIEDPRHVAIAVERIMAVVAQSAEREIARDGYQRYWAGLSVTVVEALKQISEQQDAGAVVPVDAVHHQLPAQSSDVGGTEP